MPINGEAARANALGERVFADGERFWIDAPELVGGKFTEEGNSLAVDLNSIGMGVRCRNGSQLDFSAMWIEPPDEVADLYGEP